MSWVEVLAAGQAMSKSNEPFEATVTKTSDSIRNGPSTRLALRWVFPDPRREPVWLERTVVIGREVGCDVVIASNQVSRRHAEIEAVGPARVISDLGSKNGIQVNANAVKGRALLSGDVLRIGDAVAVVVEALPGTNLEFQKLGESFFGGYLHALALERLRQLARTDLSVVLEGATGTGKERFAQMLHLASGRQGQLITVNCAVYAPNMAAAELFGYRRGAFTGAEQASAGHVRAAQGGTLFLDELPELPLAVQPMLLRAIENHEVFPIGETRAHKIDVRFVAASQAPLAFAVESGHFRADLQARLEGGVVRLPRLSQCREIIPELFVALFEGHTGHAPLLTPGFVEALCLYDFPLNIRQLDTLVRRIVLTNPPGQALSAATLTQAFDSAPPPEAAQRPSRPPLQVPGRSNAVYSDQELAALKSALARNGGNLSRAAAELGISRQRAYRMLEHAG